jgi:L-fuculose-phosphate aldolase
MLPLLELAHNIADYTICGEGNVSERTSKDTLLIKASGTSLHTLSLNDLTAVDTDANQLHSSDGKPSIEVLFHAWIMKNFPEINYIAHTHPPKTTQILCSPAVNDFANQRWFPDQIVRNGIISCVVPYAPPGERLVKNVAKSVTEFFNTHGYFPKLILLVNHGIITASPYKKDCEAATFMCEKSAEIFIGAKLLGGVNFLPEEEVDHLESCPGERYRREMYFIEK